MSRLGKNPIQIPEGVKVSFQEDILEVSGPKGVLKQKIHPNVLLDISEKEIKVNVRDPHVKKNKALWGLFASLIKNMLEGVTKGYEKKLEIVGVGYKASISGKTLTLNLGYTHPIEYQLPEGITGNIEKNIITVSGIDKQLVGQVAAKIRSFRKPEPYKGKGIRYVGEYIIRKAGKAAKKGE